MNPELRRNLWLEFSPHRLIAAPLAIALVLGVVAATSTGYWPWDAAGLARWGFFVVVLLWGTLLAGNSVSTEEHERTWDAQRMSAIGPWTMTWGKLLGAPAFAWYVGLLLLPVFVIGALFSSLNLEAAGEAASGYPAFRLALLLVVAAVMVHAGSLTTSIYAARKRSRFRGAGLLVLIGLPSLGLLRHLSLPFDDAAKASTVWWDATFDALDFMLASAVAFAAWAVLGAYRSMCTALEIRTRPWALPAFILFAAVWLGGFLKQGGFGRLEGAFAVLLCAVALSAAFSYGLLVAEPGGSSAWQRLRVRLRARLFGRVLEEAPLWLVAVITGLVMGVAALFTSSGNGSTSSLLPLAAMLFVVRDAAIFQFFAFARQPRRAEAAALFYLAVLYGLLPGLLFAIKAPQLAHIVLPLGFTDTGVATIIMLVQAGIAIAVAWWRWKTVHAPDTEQAGPAAGA